MSIIGTRPPLISETNFYELHHRARLAIKPGITGMWQVSGRSDITDFEEVVRLDKEYITNWNIGLDIKILLNKATIMLSSSIQATLSGRFGNSEYGRSKKAGEELFFDYAQETGAKVAVYRFPNLMGHSRPKYNSAVSTFCWAVANDEPFTVNDRSTELELLYIDDLVEGMFDLLENKEKHCEFDGVETVLKEDGRYCCVPVTHKVTLGEIVDLLQKFKQQPTTLMMPKMPDGSFAKKLYSLYLTYLPADKFKYTLKMNVDNRGSFTELVHTEDCGQVSVNISRPGITKGQHWHNSKWELFIVVAGHGLIQERNINTGSICFF